MGAVDAAVDAAAACVRFLRVNGVSAGFHAHVGAGEASRHSRPVSIVDFRSGSARALPAAAAAADAAADDY